MPEMESPQTVLLRPHHALDILRDFGYGVRYTPHPFGHALHLIAPQILHNPDIVLKLVIAPDAICAPCSHLRNGLCDDLMLGESGLTPKHPYNDALDARLLEFLGLGGRDRIASDEFWTLVGEKVNGLETVCAHPDEDPAFRRTGLVSGLRKLGVECAGEKGF